MKLNSGSFLVIFLFTLNGLVNLVTTEGSGEMQINTESSMAALATLVDGDEFNSQDIKGDEIKIDEVDNYYDEDSSDEDVDEMELDSSTGGMDSMQISAEQISPIINQLLGPLSTTIAPYLGPLAPLSSTLSGVISQTVTEMVVNLLNQTVASAKRPNLRLKRLNSTLYTPYLVKIPTKGRFLLFVKKPTTTKGRGKNRDG